MTKPTNEEQIEWLERIASFSVSPLIPESILASLLHYQSIRSAELPVEPARWDWTRDGMSEQPSGQFVESVAYDALKAYALKEKERADDWQAIASQINSDWIPANTALAERAEKAESELAALLAAPAPEPVAYLMIGISQHDENEPLLFLARELDIAEKYAKDQGVPITPLYTTPPSPRRRINNVADSENGCSHD